MNENSYPNEKLDKSDALRDMIRIQPQEIYFGGWVREDDEIIISDLDARDRD